MKKSFYLFLATLVFLTSCSVAKKASYDPYKKYSPVQLREDFSLLQNILHSNHPSLYWYASKDSVDGYFAATEASLNDSLTEHDFKNKVSWAVAKIHCGHTTVRASKKYYQYYSRHPFPQFPLSLKVWGDSAVVVRNLLPDSAAIKRGAIITAINGRAMKLVIDSMCGLIGTDGYSINFKYQLISFNFPVYYRNAFGTDSQYLINYVDTLGNLKETTLKNYDFKLDSIGRKLTLVPRIPKKQLKKLKLLTDRKLMIDTALNTAFLSVNTFNEGKLIRFFNRSFKKIHSDHIKNLVIDLRLNSGGSVLACTRLSQYLTDKPFHVADTVAAFSRSFPYKKHIKPWFIYWLSMHLSGRKYEDRRIHFRYFEHHLYKPKKKNHFDGNIYLLTGGYTFSAATLVTTRLKGQHNVKVVGEETGGGAYGNSAMFLTNIILPNTGIQITLPLYRMVLDATLPKNGRGVFPDVKVDPRANFIKLGIDPKVEKVKEMIKATEMKTNQ